jgi:7-carboxy-7-deazaguanine synthase
MVVTGPAAAPSSAAGERVQVDPERLRITEIFHSVQGEAREVGWPTVFVRLTGCPLRCTWCDTSYAFAGGEWRTIEQVLAEVARFDTRHVCVTGGEPLAQKRCLALLERLCDAGHAVSLETSGALDIAGVDPRVSRVLDLKAPASGEAARNRWENLALLSPRDQVKFVLADRADYEWARDAIRTHAIETRCEVLLSPVHGQLTPRALAEWLLEDRLQARLQVQLHKLLWGDAPGH